MVPMTLQQLAAASGVSASHLGRIERGERFPSARILRKIAKPLGLTESELFTLAGYLPSESSARVESEVRPGQLDPYVAAVLSREPVDIQRTVVTILSVIKSMAQSITREGGCDIGFAEYVHRRYPGADEDTITMIQDVLERPPKG